MRGIFIVQGTRGVCVMRVSRQKGWAGATTSKHISAQSIYVHMYMYIHVYYIYTTHRHTKPHYAYALHAKKLPPRHAPRKTSRKQVAEADTINMHNL